MDEILLRQLSRQLKLLNFWISFFGVLFLLLFAAAGFILYRAYTELHKAENSLTSLQQKTENTLNVQSQLCGANGSLGSLLKNDSGICN